jgi:hypothetical protein
MVVEATLLLASGGANEGKLATIPTKDPADPTLDARILFAGLGELWAVSVERIQRLIRNAQSF